MGKIIGVLPIPAHFGKAYKTKDLAIFKILALIIYCSNKWKWRKKERKKEQKKDKKKERKKDI
jgi:hypothetical protein